MPSVLARVSNSAGLSTTAPASFVVAAPARVPLHATITWADGSTLGFDEALATNFGDYDDGWVHQQCFRQIQGDILVDFRPDAPGKAPREEVVFELGSLHRFAATAPSHPATATGNAPRHIGVPAAPVLATVPGGPVTQKGNAQIVVSQITPDGESAGVYAWITLAAGDRPVVKAPLPLLGATGYMVRSGPFLQTLTPVPIGEDWTSPVTGLIATGAQTSPAPRTVTCRIKITGGTLSAPVEIIVPVWYWRTGFRWMTAPRPVLFSGGDLVAQNLVAPLDSKYLYSAVPKSTPPAPWYPGSNGGVYVGMPDTGDRDDIGWETEWMARSRFNGDPASEQRWRAAAEASHSVPWLVRDVASGAVLDLRVRKYPAFNDSDSTGVDRIPGDARGVRAANWVTPDAAHMPELAALAFARTRDPYFLEGAQAQQAYGAMESNLYRKANTSPTLATGQVRAHAWAGRDAFLLSMVTPETVPDWLLPRSYYREVMAERLVYEKKYTANPARACSVFGLLIDTNQWTIFQYYYLCLATCMIANSGQYPEWGDTARYVTRLLVQMAHPTDKYAWDHRNRGMYYFPIGDARRGAAATGTPNALWRVVDTINTPTDLAELHSLMPAVLKSASGGGGWIDPATIVGDNLAKPHNGYLPWERATLALAAKFGITDSQLGHDWLAAQLAKVTGPLPIGSVKFAIAPP